jgi:hypothetical protein
MAVCPQFPNGGRNYDGFLQAMTKMFEGRDPAFFRAVQSEISMGKTPSGMQEAFPNLKPIVALCRDRLVEQTDFIKREVPRSEPLIVQTDRIQRDVPRRDPSVDPD